MYLVHVHIGLIFLKTGIFDRILLAWGVARYRWRWIMTKCETRLMPNGKPKYIRVYDNGGETADRYTVVYTGNYNAGVPRNVACTQYVGMSGSPYHPQGFCQHGESFGPIDRPRYKHLGKKITFEQLPKDCQDVVIHDYKAIWNLN